MRKELVFVLMFVLMFGLVSGAGYNVVVPATVTPPADLGGSTGGGSTTVAVNTSDNETVSGDDADDGLIDDIGDAIGDGVDAIKDAASEFGWKGFLILIGGLAIIGGAVWYVLMDRRKKFVEVKVKPGKADKK